MSYTVSKQYQPALHEGIVNYMNIIYSHFCSYSLCDVLSDAFQILHIGCLPCQLSGLWHFKRAKASHNCFSFQPSDQILISDLECPDI